MVLPGLYATGIIFLDQNHEKVITLLLPQSIYLNQLSLLAVIISIHFRLTEIDFNFEDWFIIILSFQASEAMVQFENLAAECSLKVHLFYIHLSSF